MKSAMSGGGRWRSSLPPLARAMAFARSSWCSLSPQLANLARGAEQIIPNSCGTQIYKGIRDTNEARRISAMLGTQTIEVEDFHTNEQARLENELAAMQVLAGHMDPMQAGFEMAQARVQAAPSDQSGRASS